MLVVDVSYNLKKPIYNFGVYRISPKRRTPENGEECTYKLISINENNKKEEYHTIKYPYSDSLKLSSYFMKDFISLKIPYTEQKVPTRLHSKDMKTIFIDISINREKYTHTFILEENSKTKNEEIYYNVYFLPSSEKYENKQDLKFQIKKEKNILNVVNKTFKEAIKLKIDFNNINEAYKIKNLFDILDIK